MEENKEKPLLKISVPYNNEIIANSRRKARKGGGIGLMLSSLIFVALTVLAAIGKDPAVWAIVLFAVFAAACIVTGIVLLCLKPTSAKNDGKNIKYSFYKDYLHIDQDTNLQKGKSKTLSACLYRQYKNKQYVWKIYEYNNYLQFSIYTGTYNGFPQYSHQIIPKSVMPPEVLNALIKFLKAKVGEDYIVK